MNTATMERRPAQLEYATITVQYANEKKAGARNATIKDTDGAYYWVKPEELHLFQPGVAYDISFVTTQSNGYNNRTIKSAEAKRQEPAPRQTTRPAPQPQQRNAPVQQHTPQDHQPQNGSVHNGNINYRQQTHPADSRSMFICSQINAAIASRQINMHAIDAVGLAELIEMLGRGYDLGQERLHGTRND